MGICLSAHEHMLFHLKTKLTDFFVAMINYSSFDNHFVLLNSYCFSMWIECVILITKLICKWCDMCICIVYFKIIVLFNV